MNWNKKTAKQSEPFALKTCLRNLGAAMILISSLAGCKKCVTCSYNSNGTEFSSGKICGSPSEIKDIETQYKASAAAAGTTETCVEE